jgi:hypothetical protein
MFSPEYDQPQRIKTVEGWFKEMGFKEIFAGNIKYNNNTAAVVKGIR